MTSNSESQGEWYTTDCGRTQFTLPVRYQNLVHIGYGASGTVIRATDTETGKYVAIKKIFHPFRSQMHAKQTYQRLKQLMYLNHPDAQVVQLYNVFTPEKNIDDFQTLYFVLNYVDYDLSRVIKRNVPFTEDQIKYIIYSLLRGLKFIHSAGIFHHELNPSDIGMDKNSNIAMQLLILADCRQKQKKDYNVLFGFKYDPVTKTLTSGVSPEGIDFLDCLLTFDHRTRPTAEEALSHPFLKTFHNPMDEPTKEFLVDEHQAKVYSTAEWKSIIWQMIEEFVPPFWINDEDDIADD
ncbi:unnamed protein product [Rotaria socialis]|uniref:Protein kinase domain-containing protein n=1 Tax=Rotaria socialis TaxID=392032 RepID=A0A818PLR5_9BILA|nr:unnamed protein product [Rotaria socialis]